jgi:hypothetical protein
VTTQQPFAELGITWRYLNRASKITENLENLTGSMAGPVALRLPTQHILVRARGGTVILQGTVPEQSQVELAGQVAKGVGGVTSVKNALTIRPVGN